MAKLKICPVCKAKNSPAVLECVECGNDLMGVQLVDEELLQMQSEPAVFIDSDIHTGDLFRICDCGAKNEVSARKCSSCGEDISDIVPTPEIKEPAQPRVFLTSYDGTVRLELICPREHIIGRENELSDYLQSKSFVSRRHARLTATQEGIFIENLSLANGTYINNEKIDNSTAYKLCTGDEIGLGGFVNQNGRQDLAAYLIIRVE